jgi:hypothetical protein
MKKDKIIVDGVEYVRADSIQNNALATELDGMPYCMVRTYSAGVFAGYLESREGKEATLRNARRIWYWDGAASLSQLATDGTSKPENCKFPCPVDSVTLTEVIEIIPITERAKKSIEEVAVWKM